MNRRQFEPTVRIPVLIVQIVLLVDLYRPTLRLQLYIVNFLLRRLKCPSMVFRVVAHFNDDFAQIVFLILAKEWGSLKECALDGISNGTSPEWFELSSSIFYGCAVSLTSEQFCGTSDGI